LWKASQSGAFVVGLYILDSNILLQKQWGIPKYSSHRLQFLHESLVELKDNLRKLNIPLYVLIGNPLEAFKRMFLTLDIQTVYKQKAYGSEELANLHQVMSYLKDSSFMFHDSKPLYHIDDLPMTIEKLPDVFTLFRQQIEKKANIRETFSIPAPLKQSIDDLIKDDFEQMSALYEYSSKTLLKGGENQGLSRVNRYFFETRKLAFYKQTRNQMLRLDDSSKLSPYLALWCLSPRDIYEQLKTFEQAHVKNLSTYWLYFELLWRDYFHFIHVKYGNLLFNKTGLFDRTYQVIENKDFIEAWKNGKTGYPLVDANMIELRETGWMSNRGRQNVASFFCHYIKQDWRIGAAWFEYLLIDNDVSSNYGNWLYQAGLGVDPRQMRIFDVVWQGNQYDSATLYLRKWIPEFKKIPKEKRYVPMTLSIEEQQTYDFILGRDYPIEIVKKPWISMPIKSKKSSR
jgi:deoxyribodipyrimidine photo-lyase